MSLLSLVPAGISLLKTAVTAFNKPKPSYPTETLDAIKKMISNNQSDIKSKTLLNMMSSQAKSQGAEAYQRSQHGLDILKAKGDLSEGQYAKGLLEAGTQTQKVVGQQTQQAGIEQYKQNKSALAMIDQARLQIAQIKDGYRQQFKQQKQQWSNELMGGVLDTASTGFNTIMKGIGDKKITDTINIYLGGQDISAVLSDPDKSSGLLSMLMMMRMGYNPQDNGINNILNSPLSDIQGMSEDDKMRNRLLYGEN